MHTDRPRFSLTGAAVGAGRAVVADGLTDEGFEPVQDLEAASDCSQAYAYRIIAKNEQGSSPPSAALQIPCTAMTDPEAGR